MSRPVTVSAIQLPVRKEGETPEEIKLANLQRSLEGLRAAAERGSDVALLPEYSNIHNLPTEGGVGQWADPVPGPYSDALAAAAREHSMNVLAPMLAVLEGALRNATLLFARDGSLVGQYFKVHLPKPEADWGVAAGDAIAVFDLDLGRVGVMTCMDVEYPEHALTLMLRGAEIIFFPHVQSGWGEVDWEIRYRARAVDTGLFLVSACYGTRPEDAWTPGMMIGRSGVIGRDGGIIAEAGRYAGVVTAHLDLDCKRISSFHFAKNCERTLAIEASRRPECYHDLVRTDLRDEALRRAEELLG
jgi:predicted amidohydrolase